MDRTVKYLTVPTSFDSIDAVVIWFDDKKMTVSHMRVFEKLSDAREFAAQLWDDGKFCCVKRTVGLYTPDAIDLSIPIYKIRTV